MTQQSVPQVRSNSAPENMNQNPIDIAPIVTPISTLGVTHTIVMPTGCLAAGQCATKHVERH